jgi:diphthamide biosynthesis protein 3
MSGIYDEVEIEDMQFDEQLQVYSYPCPCGDKFSIALVSVANGMGKATGACESVGDVHFMWRRA